MATHPIAQPKHWDDRCKYFYRKLAGFRNQPLIDKLDECLDMHHGRKPIAPSYTTGDIVRIAKVIIHILTMERELDLDLAKADYDWLEKEVQRAIAQP